MATVSGSKSERAESPAAANWITAGAHALLLALLVFMLSSCTGEQAVVDDAATASPTQVQAADANSATPTEADEADVPAEEADSATSPAEKDTAEPQPAIWREQGHVNAVAYVVAQAFAVEGEPPTFVEVFDSFAPANKAAIEPCFDAEVRSRIADPDVEVIDAAYAALTRGDGAAALLACVQPALVRQQLLTTVAERRSLPGTIQLSWSDPCIQSVYPLDDAEALAAEWIAEMSSDGAGPEASCPTDTGESGFTNRFVNPAERAVSDRFAVDGPARPLGDYFARNLGVDSAEIAACFDTELRAAIGDDAVEDYARVVDEEDYWSPAALATRIAASTALFECVPADLIRTAAIERELGRWGLFVRPGGAGQVVLEDACAQSLYSQDLAVFREEWLGLLLPPGGYKDLRAGTCIADPVFKEVTAAADPSSPATVGGPTLEGTRGLTLQWISWEPDDWGVASFESLGDERYSVEGRQAGDGDDYVFIKGTMTRLDESQLHLDGVVETRTSFLNGGAICVRAGTMVFEATGDRNFWRMQDQINCDGETTDYVDIYFG